jgi:hypothetical protein
LIASDTLTLSRGCVDAGVGVRAPLVVGECTVVDLTALTLHVGDTAITGAAAADSAEEGRQDVQTPLLAHVWALLIRVRADLRVQRALVQQHTPAVIHSCLAQLRDHLVKAEGLVVDQQVVEVDLQVVKTLKVEFV